MFEDRRIQLFVLAAVCALFVGARFWGLADSCLWFDEIFTVHAAEHTWDSLPWFVAQDLIHPPLFYMVLKLWMLIGGDGVFWLRLLPVLFSVVVLIPFLLLARELKLTTWTTVLALFLLAVNGPNIKFVQFVRMYTMLMCLSLFSIWLFARFLDRGSGLVVLTIVNVLLVYTHYFGLLVVGTEVAAILIFQRSKWRGIFAMAGIAFIAFLPWLYLVAQAISNPALAQNIGWVNRPGIKSVVFFALALVRPFYFQTSSDIPMSLHQVTIPALLIVLTATVLFILNWKRRSSEEKRAVHFLGFFAFVPLIAVFAASWLLPFSFWGERHLIIVTGPLMLLIAIVLTRFNEGWLRTTAITLMIVLSAYAFYLRAGLSAGSYVWCAWEPIARDFAVSGREAGVQPKKLYAFEDLGAYHLWFALRNSDEPFKVSRVKRVEGMADDTSYFLPRGFYDVDRVDLKDITEPRVWLAFRTDKAGQEFPLFDALKDLGYTRCTLSPNRFGKTTVFLMEMAKEPEACTEQFNVVSNELPAAYPPE